MNTFINKPGTQNGGSGNDNKKGGMMDNDNKDSKNNDRKEEKSGKQGQNGNKSELENK